MKKSIKTGRVNVYVMHSTGFFGKLRPCYDSAADAIGELTDNEVSTLRSMIAKYIERCHERHGSANLQTSVSNGNHA